MKEQKDRSKLIKNIKAGADLAMYIGAAGLMGPIMRKAQENHNPAMNLCIFASTSVLTLGIGKIAGGWVEKTIDDIAAFIEEVKAPKKEETDNG